ncbi:MAG: hypothetical protein V1721_00865 [Pseudomonadota bacterium]
MTTDHTPQGVWYIRRVKEELTVCKIIAMQETFISGHPHTKL